jgi:hypothetical protein
LINSAAIMALRDFLKEYEKKMEQNNSSKIEKHYIEKFKITSNHIIQAKDKMMMNSKNKIYGIDQKVGRNKI